MKTLLFLCYNLGLSVTCHKINSVAHAFQKAFTEFCYQDWQKLQQRERERELQIKTLPLGRAAQV